MKPSMKLRQNGLFSAMLATALSLGAETASPPQPHLTRRSWYSPRRQGGAFGSVKPIGIPTRFHKKLRSRKANALAEPVGALVSRSGRRYTRFSNGVMVRGKQDCIPPGGKY